MSGRVDVLAVMDYCTERAAGEESAHEMSPHDSLRIKEARAAVAELIEASVAFGRETDGGMQPCGRDVARRFAAALARVTGGQI